MFARALLVEAEALPLLGICEKHGLSNTVQMYEIKIFSFIKFSFWRNFIFTEKSLPLPLTPYIIRYPRENQKLNFVTVLLAEMWTLLNFHQFSTNTVFLFQDLIQDLTPHLVVMSPLVSSNLGCLHISPKMFINCKGRIITSQWKNLASPVKRQW